MRSRLCILLAAAFLGAGCDNPAARPQPTSANVNPKPPTAAKGDASKSDPAKGDPAKPDAAKEPAKPESPKDEKKPQPAAAGPYGAIKGQIVWAEAKIPTPRILKPNKDQDHCGNDLPSNELIIDPKTSGVKNVLIWLDSTKLDGVIANIHPSLAAVPQEPVIINQPKCQFEPRVVALREGQPLIITNKAPKAHNAKIIGKNRTENPLIPPGSQIEIKDDPATGKKALQAEQRPYLLGCDIHGWMGGRIGVFKHPYFAISAEDGTFEIKNIPAGDLVIFLQHEASGWVHEGGKNGQKITIKAGEVVDLGKIKMKNVD